MSSRPVVLVHGIWMPGFSMQVLARRLAAHAYSPAVFSYAAVARTLDENAARLAGFLAARDLRRPHLVGHSLGGVVALRLLQQHPDRAVGRVVCLGSPLTGSRTAAVLAGHRWGRAIAGKSLSAGVIERPASAWAKDVLGRVEVGCIAGTTPLGAGRLLTRFDGEHDGTVAVAETRLAGLRDHLCLPVNHTGLVWSGAVADQVAAFLANGRFTRPGST